jgi:hypothetical protein
MRDPIERGLGLLEFFAPKRRRIQQANSLAALVVALVGALDVYSAMRAQ